MRIDVKPLTHWVIYKGYKVRFTARRPPLAEGVLTTPEGVEMRFVYDASKRVIALPDEHIHINEYGWEIERVRHEPTNDA
ncbi:MAG: hypothetical protein NZ553_10350 [Caldilinea sp.]|nr:hypothetical protein [Caldilinea sp.]MDW8440861.1 hypothetical protein [Caldilineaceae bacterium]